MDRDRDFDRNHRNNRHNRFDQDDRDFGDRAMDEMRSWFGDDEAEYRRRMDEMERDRQEGGRQRDERNRYRDELERGRADRGRGMSRGWDVDRDWSRAGGRYGGYGDMGRAGGSFGGPFGRGMADRMAVDDFGGGYGRDHTPRERATRSDRWGASDWSEQAARAEGRFSGRGPSGYQRSAERIVEDANEALTWAGDVDASQIQVTVDGDEITLEGTVDSRHAKRAAENAVEGVRGVRDVHNRLRVQAQGSDKTTSSM